MTQEKLSGSTQYARATVLSHSMRCLLVAPCSETSQKQQNTLLWPFPCSGIPVPSADERICRSSCVWGSAGRSQPNGSRAQAPAAGKHKDQPVAESPIQHLSLTANHGQNQKCENISETEGHGCALAT